MKLHPYVAALLFALPAVLIGAWIPYAIACFIDPRHLSDFAQYYTAGWCLRDGLPLYGLSAIAKETVQHVGVLSDSIFVKPAFESLLYLPLTLVSFSAAYAIYAVWNLALLYFVHRTLRPLLPALGSFGSWLPGALYVAYLPVIHAILQGQDSVLYMALTAAAFLRIQRGELFSAGVLLGITDFRFQNTLILVLLFMAWKSWRLLRGYALSSAICAGASLVLMGWRGVAQYLQLLKVLESYPAMNVNMVSLRGTLSALGCNSQPVMTTLAILVVASTWWFGRGLAMEKRFLLALSAMCLSSPHMFAYDLSSLVLPLLILAERGIVEHRTGQLVFAGVFLATPTVLYSFLPSRFSFLLAIPIAAMLIHWALYSEVSEIRSSWSFQSS